MIKKIKIIIFKNDLKNTINIIRGQFLNRFLSLQKSLCLVNNGLSSVWCLGMHRCKVGGSRKVCAWPLLKNFRMLG
jgi:hypothetical protein